MESRIIKDMVLKAIGILIFIVLAKILFIRISSPDAQFIVAYITGVLVASFVLYHLYAQKWIKFK